MTQHSHDASSRRRPRITKRAAIVTGAVVLIGGALSVGVATGSIPDSSGTIHACYNKSGGALQVIDSAATCGSNETSISWNQTGPQGATGPQGPKGDVGPAGPKGDVGPVGPVGLKGDTGPQGAVGPKGDVGPAGAKGDTGPAGPVGPIGPAGPKGDTGSQGPAGPSGAMATAGGVSGTAPVSSTWVVVDTKNITLPSAGTLIGIGTATAHLTDNNQFDTVTCHTMINEGAIGPDESADLSSQGLSIGAADTHVQTENISSQLYVPLAAGSYEVQLACEVSAGTDTVQVLNPMLVAFAAG